MSARMIGKIISDYTHAISNGIHGCEPELIALFRTYKGEGCLTKKTHQLTFATVLLTLARSVEFSRNPWPSSLEMTRSPLISMVLKRWWAWREYFDVFMPRNDFIGIMGKLFKGGSSLFLFLIESSTMRLFLILVFFSLAAHFVQNCCRVNLKIG